ncbi:biotin--[acetyl-CoA-carboxylase] ligase [Sulfurospirillum deleyianum]|uniref:Biotin/acetyl-CoA-carboxylase ligase n=1 Tax=Sulfurospirillum deleyianum (strain ATCC 51133 / DSM 6946 / 5175) TaxID=525898 RepID=D1AZS7_SULD5|nr:biotin--[acetyl-CoA-carboxylase] ligase [Sulfurospirillum deleyianum]ACZ11544.1 biotin/acetyl-CoA-carboxylase ligase [Sulfurospirillum deleyianum DSM 6946]
MVIHWFETLESTHHYLITALRNGTLFAPCGVGADIQTNGVGSRGNRWIGEGGNLFFSFCLEEKALPLDLPLASVSIYFSALMKEILAEQASKVWLKWPNDFYLDTQKIGGMITTKIGSNIVGSVGLNIAFAPENFGKLDIAIAPALLAKMLVEKITEKKTWKKVFSNYKIEFDKNRSYSFHLDGKLVSLKDAILCDDGSIELENKKVYSLR